MRPSASIGISSNCSPHPPPVRSGSRPPTFLRMVPKCDVVVALPGARANEVVVQMTPTGLQIETTVAPPSPRSRMQVVRLEIPYGRMRRRIDLPPGRYALIERRLDRGCLYLRLDERGAMNAEDVLIILPVKQRGAVPRRGAADRGQRRGCSGRGTRGGAHPAPRRPVAADRSAADAPTQTTRD